MLFQSRLLLKRLQILPRRLWFMRLKGMRGTSHKMFLQMLIFLRDQRPRSCHLRAALKKDKETSGDIYYFPLPTISSLPAASALTTVLHVTTAVLSTLPAAPPSTVEFSYSKITSFVNNIDTCVDLYRQINSGVKNLPALKDLANPEAYKDVSCTWIAIINVLGLSFFKMTMTYYNHLIIGFQYAAPHELHGDGIWILLGCQGTRFSTGASNYQKAHEED